MILYCHLWQVAAIFFILLLTQRYTKTRHLKGGNKVTKYPEPGSSFNSSLPPSPHGGPLLPGPPLFSLHPPLTIDPPNLDPPWFSAVCPSSDTHDGQSFDRRLRHRPQSRPSSPQRPATSAASWINRCQSTQTEEQREDSFSDKKTFSIFTACVYTT